MSRFTRPWSDRLPMATPLPVHPVARRWAPWARVGAWVLLGAVLVVTIVQFQVLTHRQLAKAARRLASQPSAAVGADAVKAHKGAIGRWRKAFEGFWTGQDIYRRQADPGQIGMHPNMPFVVILLSPLARLRVEPMVLLYNLIKVGVFLAALPMLARVAGHGRARVADYVVGLGLLWSLQMVIADLQHANTNLLVLGAIAAHLWLYRRGRDGLSGGALAMAICLKMTPALFVLYWAYQRRWRVVGWTLAALAVTVLVVPAVALGPDRAMEVTHAWLDNMIVPGLVKSAWYPIHVNQSLPGVFARYFLAGPGGDIYWGPDDNPYEAQTEHGWITLMPLGDRTVKALTRLAQLAILLLMAWGVGWQVLPRDDGRRMLQYGLMVTGMMLLNQRTWAHHAAVLLVADIAILQAIWASRAAPAVRKTAMALMLLAGAMVWLTPGDLFGVLSRLTGGSEQTGERWADLASAFGPLFYHCLLLLVCGVMLSVALRRMEEPYWGEAQRAGPAPDRHVAPDRQPGLGVG